MTILCLVTIEESVVAQDDWVEPLCHALDPSDQFVTVSDKTPNVLWQALWNEDKTKTIALNNGLGQTYTLVNAVPIDNQDIRILASNKDLAIAYLKRDQTYFEVLYLLALDEDQYIKIQLHRVARSEFERIRQAHKNNLSLAQPPTTQLEACYVIIMNRDLYVDVRRDVLNSTRSNYNKNLEDFLKARQANLTISTGIWKDSDHISGFHRQVSLNVELEDTNNQHRPVNIAFKQFGPDFEDENVVEGVDEPLITGLDVPTNYFGWFAAPYTDYDDRITNLRLKNKSFNPLQFVFGFYGPISEYDQARADFTITVSTHQQNRME